MKVIGDKIFIKILKQDGETYKGGLIIPDSAYKKYLLGQITQIGTGRKIKGRRIPFDEFEIGDKIIIPRGVGSNHEIDGEEYLFLQNPIENAVVVLK